MFYETAFTLPSLFRHAEEVKAGASFKYINVETRMSTSDCEKMVLKKGECVYYEYDFKVCFGFFLGHLDTSTHNHHACK